MKVKTDHIIVRFKETELTEHEIEIAKAAALEVLRLIIDSRIAPDELVMTGAIDINYYHARAHKVTLVLYMDCLYDAPVMASETTK